MLGLAAYVQAGGDRPPAPRCTELAEGIAAMSAGTTTGGRTGRCLPWALSRSDWHAWGRKMPAALAAAATALDDQCLLAPAVADAAGFTAQLLTSTGPVNGLLPTPVDAHADRLRRRRPGPGTARRRDRQPAFRDPRSWPASPPAGSSARTRRASPYTTRRPALPRTVSPRTGPSTTTPVPSRPFTVC